MNMYIDINFLFHKLILILMACTWIGFDILTFLYSFILIQKYTFWWSLYSNILVLCCTILLILPHLPMLCKILTLILCSLNKDLQFMFIFLLFFLGICFQIIDMIDESNDINNNSIRERRETMFLKNKIEKLNTI